MKRFAKWFALSLTVLALQLVGPMPSSRALAAGGSAVGNSARLGLGLQGGTVSGLSLKYYLSGNSALQVGLGGGWYGYGVNLEYLIHPVVLAQGPAVTIPFYFGGGLGFGVWGGLGYSGVNIHVPLGLAFNLTAVPVDLFVQFEPGIGIGRDYYEHSYLEPWWGGTAGARIYF